jgi:hypothetical protein
MDIQSASIDLSQPRLQEQAAVQVQAMSLDAAREQGAAVEELIASAPQPITDPNLGQLIDITA